MNKLAESFKKLDYDSELALCALDEILVSEEENYYRYNPQVSSEIDEIKNYLVFLLEEKNISPDEIYDSLEQNETQRLYDRLQNIQIEFFTNFTSFNIWNEYIKKGSKTIYINNASQKYKAICGKFWELDLEELYKLDDFFGEESHQNIAVEYIKNSEEENITVH